MNDEFGDRMKLYEGIESDRRFMPLLPVIARIDGRAFHTFTADMKRPYDAELSALMRDTTMYLVEETGAQVGYTQSDEITLAWFSDDTKRQIWFDGRIAKMTSQLGAHATLWFNKLLVERAPQFADRLPTFDARVWQVPNLTEAANVFVWRELDATKNSITMAAGAYYSHDEIHGKDGSEKQELLFQKGINWNDYPVYFKRGVYVQRKSIFKKFSAKEIESLPPKHAARTNSNLIVERSEIRAIELPIIRTIANREAVLFEGAEPILQSAPRDLEE